MTTDEAATTNGHKMDEWQSGADSRRLIELTGELIGFVCTLCACVMCMEIIPTGQKN